MSAKVHSIGRTVILSTLYAVYGNIQAQPSQKPSHRTPISIHEADEQDLKVLAHIEFLQKEICSQINVCRSAAKTHELKHLFDELEIIAKDYIELSPGTAFLGPFSSVSLVLKQRDLRKRIAQIEKLIFKA